MHGTFELEKLTYSESPGVYPVREDSLLLFNALLPTLRSSKGAFLDMGCGCGMNGLAAAREGWKVLMVDREPRAAALARRNLMANGLDAEVCISDLMEGVGEVWRGSFDLASFNPPYLEDDGDVPPRERLHLSGQPTSIQLTNRFLTEVGPFMRPHGQVMLLVPGLWDLGTLSKGTGLSLEEMTLREDRSTGEPFNVLRYVRPSATDL